MHFNKQKRYDALTDKLKNKLNFIETSQLEIQSIFIKAICN